MKETHRLADVQNTDRSNAGDLDETLVKEELPWGNRHSRP